MKGHSIMIFFRLTRYIVMFDLMIAGKNSLDWYILDLLPKRSCIYSSLAQCLHNRCQWSFEARLSISSAIRSLKLRVKFIYSIVSQVLKVQMIVIFIWSLILFCGETGESIVIQIYSQRIYTANQHIYSQIKFITID